MLYFRNLLVALLLGAAASGCAESVNQPDPVASVEVASAASSVTVGQTVQLVATIKDAAGNPLSGRTVSWSSGSTVATVDGNGLVTGVEPGSATLTATVEGQTGSAAITVLPVPVASVSVSPDSVILQMGGTRQLAATVRDAGGNSLAGRPVSWSTSNDAIVAVSGSGLVTSVGVGAAIVTAVVEGRAATVLVTVRHLGPDTDAPVLLAVSFDVTTADVTTEAKRVEATWRVRDAGVGMGDTGLFFSAPVSGQSVFCTANRISGSATEGHYRCSLTFPKSAAAGTWKVSTLYVRDAIGNRRDYDASQLQAAGFPSELTIVSGSADTSPPVLTAFSLSPGSVSLATGDAVVEFTYSVMDGGVGLGDTGVFFNAPVSGQSVHCTASRISGTANDGVYRCSVKIQQGKAAGLWTASTVYVRDAVGNRQDYDAGRLKAAGFAFQFTVTY
jgi:hypothetical protein